MLAVPFVASAQSNADPEGYVTYSLPMTTITLDVEAVQETFYAGPYAKYAEKYLGIKPRMKDETTVQLSQIKMTPYVEPDHSKRYSVNVPKGNMDATCLKLTPMGNDIAEQINELVLKVNAYVSKDFTMEEIDVFYRVFDVICERLKESEDSIDVDSVIKHGRKII